MIGPCDHRFTTSVFAGSEGWDALVDAERPQPVGASDNPLGAGAAASLAAGALFRHIFTDGRIDSGLRLSTYLGDIGASPDDVALPQPWPLGEFLLVGAGAIGNAAVWALTRCPATGTLHVVDDETVDLGKDASLLDDEHGLPQGEQIVDLAPRKLGESHDPPGDRVIRAHKNLSDRAGKITRFAVLARLSSQSLTQRGLRGVAPPNGLG